MHVLLEGPFGVPPPFWGPLLRGTPGVEIASEERNMLSGTQFLPPAIITVFAVVDGKEESLAWVVEAVDGLGELLA